MEAAKSINIFLSYAHADTAIADIIDNDFKTMGIYLTRDVRDLTYRSGIRDFMNQIAKSDYVVMLVSDAYLRSSSCMYEVMELLNSHEFEKRILPVVLSDAAAIYKTETRFAYYKYWDEQLKKATELFAQIPNEDALDEKKLITNINNNIDSFFKKLTDLILIDFEKLKRESYRPLLKVIGFDESLLLSEAFQIAEIKEEEEEQELAVEEFLRKYPDSSAGLFLRADVAYKNHHYIKAKSYYAEMLKLFPGNAMAHFNYALILSQHFTEYYKARLHYEKAIELNPGYYQAHTNLAKLLSEKFTLYKDARKHFESSLRLYPPDTEAKMDYGNLLRKHFNDITGAQMQYEDALTIKPGDAKAHYNLGVLYEQNIKDYKQAIFHYDEALKLNPLKANANFNLGNIYTKNLPDYDKAKLHYEKAIELNPEYAKAIFNYSLLLKSHFNNLPEAKKNYLKATLLEYTLINKELDSIYGIKR